MVVKRTKPNASKKIGRRFCLKSLHDVKYAAENRIGGRKRVKTTAGSRIRGGRPGSKLRARLPSTRRISVGRPVRLAQGTAIDVRKSRSSVASMRWIPMKDAWPPLEFLLLVTDTDLRMALDVTSHGQVVPFSVVTMHGYRRLV
jgi:hypothetical protein